MTETLIAGDWNVKGRSQRNDEATLIALALIAVSDLYEAEQLWQQNAPAPYKQLLSGGGFQYNPAAMAWSAKGSVASGIIVPWTTIKAATIATIANVEKKVRGLSDSMVAGDVELADWQHQVAAYSKSAEIAAAAVARGGIDRLSADELATSSEKIPSVPADVATTGDQVLYQYKRLQLFAGQIEQRHPLADSTLKIENRAVLYPRQAVTFAEQVRNREAKLVKMIEEMNVLGAGEHCFSKAGEAIPDCPSQSNYGWAPIGTLTPIGLRLCAMNCKCHMRYRLLSGQETK